MSDQWDVEPFPEEIGKAELEAWYSAASPGEKSALNQAVKEFQDWQNNPNQAWFGVSITPSRIQGKLRELGRKYHVPLRYLTYNVYKTHPPKP